MPYQRPLTPRQREAIAGIYDQGLMRTQGEGYWRWRWRTTGHASGIAGITIDSLARLGLAEIAPREGLDLCYLTYAGMQIAKLKPIQK